MSSNRSNRPAPKCAHCGSELVPRSGSLESDRYARDEELRCPACERRPGLYRTEAERDRQLDIAASNVEGELRRLEALRMEGWVASFVHALELDLIGPDDFRR